MKFYTLTDLDLKTKKDLLHVFEKEILRINTLCKEDLEREYDIHDLIMNLISLQDEKGFIPLVKSKTIPGDCYYYYVTKPTYITLKLILTYYREDYNEAMENLFKLGCLSQFYGRGYDSESEQVKTVTELISAGIFTHCSKELGKVLTDILMKVGQYVHLNSFSQVNQQELDRLYQAIEDQGLSLKSLEERYND